MAVTAGVLNDVFSLFLYPGIKPCHSGLQKMTPMVRTHNKPSLLSPVVSEIDGVNTVFQCQIDHGEE